MRRRSAQFDPFGFFDEKFMIMKSKEGVRRVWECRWEEGCRGNREEVELEREK